ncbi:laminin subunit alpha-3-like isoform X2 [Salarias fasciatus]|uniref:laminin subunit alpha-3-like isoform X2 n=1 Tax=Salarias fasciatus TaxID=181472 RepID=UPI001176EC61|nr:laminin subunit alpha-3 isoform X2 [Salarias fasciatus]
MARRMRGAHLLAALCSCWITLFGEADGQQTFNDVTGFSLSPPYFNLAAGSRISASATCGQDEAGAPRQDLYCKLVGGPTTGLPTQTIQGQFCDYCNAADPNKAHPVSHAIDGTERWWQSPPLSRGVGYNGVNVTLDLGQLFHVAYVLIKFANSPRPDLWVLERSVDHGRTFSPWQYFAHSKRECIERFGKEPNARILNDDDRLCTTEYSRIVPLENGEVVVSLVNGRPGSRNFTYSPVLRDFTKATNVRLHFLRTNTLLGHLISKAQRDPTVTRRYYYSIKDISIGGRCVCHGHAQVCGGAPDEANPNRLQCECQHNTCGESCDRCCPGFNQKPWRAATVDSPNECQPCQCFSHAADCYYDPEVERRRASLDTFGRYDGGGVCINCQHNTAGVNCEQCLEGFYRPHGVAPESPTGCIPCRCDQRTTAGCQMGSGRCICKPQFTGENCDRCSDGYYYYPECIRYPVYTTTTESPAGPIVVPSACPPGFFNPPYCQPCNCDYSGTVSGVCDSAGRCLCRQGVEGERCDRCRPGYHSFPNCQACYCDYSGTESGVCDPAGRCLCRQGVEGERCDRCRPGYHSFPSCQACNCDYSGTESGPCDPAGRCLCRQGVEGERCDRCRPGYHSFPSCQACNCDYSGTASGVCDPAGRCLCRQGVEGERCDRCRPGYHSFPSCQECVCDGAGVAERVCGPDGRCSCLPNFGGAECDECAPGYYGYPDCAVCRCSPEGSYGAACNPLSGQCLCLPGVVGQQCDRCASGLRFPQCSAPVLACNAAGTESSDPQTGSCRCRANVEGNQCERCKPLYWNLAADNPRGCTDCECDLKGTLSGLGECRQGDGQCFCKPAACGQACDTCKDGYFLLQKKNYFGCQGCQCDVGGAIDSSCDETSGQCRCRNHVVSRNCTEPAAGYYFPNLHHLKFEVEDGTTPAARPVRFGFDPQEFPEFSWRGYAVMSPAQSEVRVTVHVDPKDGRQHLYRVLLRFINPRSSSVTGSIQATSTRGTAGPQQSKEVVFPRSPSPAFLTVPGDGFAEPFTLNPGKWIIHIKAEGVLLDYLVLLPREYYEAPVLQEKITEPCTYLPSADKRAHCLLYKHLAMDGFSNTLGSQGRLSARGGRRRRQARVRRLTPDHPNMAALDGRQSQLELSLRVSQPGLYALVLEYASEVDTTQNVNVLMSGESRGRIPARANIYSCALSHLCRSVALDSRNQVAMLQLTHRTEVLLQTSTTSFFLYKVYALPAEVFSIQYVNPKMLCVSTHGRFTEDSLHCILSEFDKPSFAWILYAAQDGKLSSSAAPAPQRAESEDWRRRRQSGGFPLREPPIDGILLKYPQTEISFRPEVPLPGRYVVVVHYHQPEHASFPVEVRVDAGKEWKGGINATFCPAVSGCRQVVIADGRIALDFDRDTWQRPAVSLTVPPNKTLILDYIMLVPDDSYTPELLKEKPLDKSAEFTQQCRGEGFYIHPSGSSQFCRESARSLVAAYNDGALPCDCDPSGSTRTLCDPDGGQCPCRQHVIGRRCTKCATGYYGFPYCRPCECGRRLCDEVTGRCICPPQTVRPACDVCQNQTFSFHPLLGCESCGCSPNGVLANPGPQCDRLTGQCSCKPRIGGRQCDRCAAGFYRFPDCLPCNCNQGGVTANVCDPDTGRCLCKFVQMRGWRLESSENEDVPSVLNAASNTVVADVQELPSVVQALHWVAPQSYLGNRVSSYGGFLTYQVKTFGIPSEGMKLISKRPDVILTGQNMTLIHMAPQDPLPDRLYQGRVQLLEGNWRHAGTNRPVSREELMMVLANLAGLRIRALYFTQSQRLSLGEVGLERATGSGTGSPGNTVEVCSCPPQYDGDSCERCAPGYYRESSLGSCIPCKCNGLADECEDRTGKCLDCQYNSAGDQCERCKDGYYGNAAQRTCRVCPCPFTTPANSFAVGCMDVFGDVKCLCKSGYTGERCENCAPGYYGDPLTPGGSCKPCNCFGNGNNCDRKTGVCKSTLEPGDTNIDDTCKECDNCAQTLLQDLEKLDDELGRIKSQLDNATASASSQERLKKLEKAVQDTKTLVNKYDSAIKGQKSKVTQLEEDMNTLEDDINAVKNKADKKEADADKAVNDIEKTHNRAKDLDSEIQKMLKKIKDLLDQLQNEGNRGDTPNVNLAKLLEDAKKMVDEMEKRNFTPQKTAAEKERDEAKKLLDDIKTKITTQADQNGAAAEKIRNLLKDYDSKLKDLDKALKDAADLVKKANTQNGLNGQTLGDLQDRIDDMKKERKTVEDQMKLAEGELKKTEDSLKKLKDGKTEYEQLAAQLDGAKTDLTKKVNDISKAAGMNNVVEAAEDHANNLENLAKELEDTVKSASDRPEVRNAKDAIDAYKNITDAINAADAAAKEAKKAADEAFNNVKKQKLPERAQQMKEGANELLKEAQDAQKDLQGPSSELSDLLKRLADADNKKNSLEDSLQDTVNQLNNIKPAADIGNMIDEAKRKAAAANDTAFDTMGRLDEIKKELDKIKLSPSGSDLGGVLDDVDRSVKNLWKTIPSLSDKISQVEDLTTSFTPITNISNHINKIKDLIEQARDAANKIVIPMNFAGDGHVELRPPKNLDDLKAYTALSLSLQRPEGRGDGKRRRRQAREKEDLFVMYLGHRDSSKNYIGMALRNNILFGFYKLNGVEYEMQSGYISKSASEPAKFDRVDLRRIYQDAQMSLTKDITSTKPGEPIIRNKQGEESKNLLDLNPSDVVFYVGGYPDDFTPPPSLQYPKYKGCMEFSSFNDKVISLYNFQKAVNINRETPCKRYVPPEDTHFYEGTGFGKVIVDKFLSTLFIEMTINSRSENGLLLYIAGKDKYFTLTTEKGVIYIRSNVISTPATENKKLLPTSKPIDIQVIIIPKGDVLVRVDGQLAAKATAQFKLDEFKEFYTGGAPQELRERYNITIQPFKGCLRNLKLHKSFKLVDEPVGISKGCPKESLVPRKAEFALGSSLSSALTGFSLENDVTVSIGFKSTEKEGLILQDKKLANGVSLEIDNGYVIAVFNDKAFKSNKQYHDGVWHYVTVRRRAGKVEMLIDDEDSGQEQPDAVNIPDTSGVVYLGDEKFKGCLSNFYTRRPNSLYKAEDLSEFTASGDVLLDTCTPDTLAQLMMDRQSKKR